MQKKKQAAGDRQQATGNFERDPPTNRLLPVAGCLSPAACSVSAYDCPMPTPTRFASFSEFWPFYLGEHSRPLTRAFHFAGTNVALLLIVLAVVAGRPWLLLVALAVGYGLSWVGHFFVEKNRPATFRYPLWSFAGDW